METIANIIIISLSITLVTVAIHWYIIERLNKYINHKLSAVIVGFALGAATLLNIKDYAWNSLAWAERIIAHVFLFGFVSIMHWIIFDILLNKVRGKKFDYTTEDDTDPSKLDEVFNSRGFVSGLLFKIFALIMCFLVYMSAMYGWSLEKGWNYSLNNWGL